MSKKKTEKATPQDALIKEQAKRIAELKSENAALTIRLDEYRSREKELTETVAFAKKKCDEMLSDAKIKYALECERLKLFHDKWVVAAQSGYLTYGLERTEKILQECRIELEKAFADDLGITDYLSERARLNADPTLNYQAIIADEQAALPEKKKKVDCLTEKELEELIKQL